MNQQTIDQIAYVICLVSVAVLFAVRERNMKLAINQYVWRLRGSSNDYMKASMDPSMSETLRTFNHARSLESDKIAKELDLLALGGAVAHEIWILRGKPKDNDDGSKNETVDRRRGGAHLSN